MSSRSLRLQFTLVLALVLGALPLFGASAVVGSVAGSTNATVGGQVLVPNTTVFSGDNLRVNEGAAVVAMGMGSRMVFGRDTQATFERGSNEVAVVLSQGVISMYHPVDGLPLKVKVGDISVSSGKGFKSLGDVAMLNGTIIVTAKEGTLHVDGVGRTTDVAKGKTIAITPNAPAGAPQGAGSAAHHWTQAQIVNVVTLSAAGVGLGFSIADYQKTKDVQTTANDALSQAQAAASSAALAVSAAQAAEAAAVAACKAVSPNNPACGS